MINSVNAAVFWGFTYWLMGAWVRVGFRFSMPWLASQVVFYVPFAAANAILYSIFLTDTATPLTAIAGFGAVMAMVFVTALFTIVVFQEYLKAALAQAGFPPHLFLWQKTDAPTSEVRPPLPVKLVAANQYVEYVTSEKTDLVRTTLKEAIKVQAPGSGFQINRSTWVAWSAVDGVEQDRDRLHLTLSDGSAVYVSRANVAAFERDLAKYRHGFAVGPSVLSAGDRTEQ